MSKLNLYQQRHKQGQPLHAQQLQRELQAAADSQQQQRQP